MDFAGINYLAVVVAMVASMAFGSIYYMSLGRQWMTAIGKSETEIKEAGFQPPPSSSPWPRNWLWRSFWPA